MTCTTSTPTGTTQAFYMSPWRGHAHAHARCRRQCTRARTSTTQRALWWELGAAAARGGWGHLFLLSIPRGLQRGLPSPQGPGSASQMAGLICTMRALLESVPLENAQRLRWFGERGQGCSPKREGEPFPFGPLSVPSAACLPACPGPPALIPPCFLTACDPVGGLRGEPLEGLGGGQWAGVGGPGRSAVP